MSCGVAVVTSASATFVVATSDDRMTKLFVTLVMKLAAAGSILATGKYLYHEYPINALSMV